MQPIIIKLPPSDRKNLVCRCKIGGCEAVTVVKSYLKDEWPEYYKDLIERKDGKGKKAIERLISEISRDAGRDGGGA